MGIVMSILLSILVITDVSAEGPGIEVGDFWEYSGDLGASQNLSGPIKIRMSVAEKIKEAVPGSQRTEDVFRLNLSGSGQVSINALGFRSNTTATITGTLDRLTSNFSFLSASVIAQASLAVQGFEVPAKVSVRANADPSVDDYIGDHPLRAGTRVESKSQVSISASLNIIIFNQSLASMSENITFSMTVLRENVSVSVPAGTFSDCSEVNVIAAVGAGSPNHGLWYYSSKVGNYVKMAGANASPVPLFGENAVLVSYSHKGDRAFSLFSGIGVVFLAVVIAGVAVLVIVGLVARSRKNRQMNGAPPQDGGQPPGGENRKT